jgi:uncharacterized membrane protein YhhN
MTATGWTWLAAAGVLAVIDWIAVGEGARRLERIAKPLVLVALLGVAVSGSPDHSGVRGWLIAALVLGLLGDLALVSERQPELVSAGQFSVPPDKAPRQSISTGDAQLFMAGLAAFLLAHVCYVLAMLGYGTDQLSVAFGLVLVLIAVLSFGYRIIAGAHSLGGAALTIGITLYIVALGSVVVLGVGTQELAIAAGVVLFAVSDLTRAYDRFVQARSWGPLTVTGTCHLAQLLLVIGLLS